MERIGRQRNGAQQERSKAMMVTIIIGFMLIGAIVYACVSDTRETEADKADYARKRKEMRLSYQYQQQLDKRRRASVRDARRSH